MDLFGDEEEEAPVDPEAVKAARAKAIEDAKKAKVGARP
jgi:hypothetical protein